MMMRAHDCGLWLFALTAVVSVLACACSATGDTRARLRAVPFADVKLTDRFWAPRIEANRKVTVPHCLHQCEITKRIHNFEVAGGLAEGKFEGIYFNDSDVYKVIEGAAHSLASHPDPDLDARLDDLIAKIGAAQQEDGYLNTYYTLVEPDKRWTNLPVRHELYCAGHLFEAAVAHYRATGKRSLLGIATRFADHIASVFGEDGLVGVPGHEEIELALVKLYEATGEQRYLDLARFFIDKRGYSDRDYNQDHIPVREQSEIVGHAVRAMYLYSGVADVVAHTGDEALIAAMERIWRDVVLRKMYVTGGIGPSAHNEGFTVPYDLPNDTAYAETCAAIGLALWNHRLALLHADARYADVLEQVLYNGMLSGVSLDGAKFFYVNPMASRGNHHRQPWYGCACCPSNVVRFMPQVPGFMYATSPEGLWVNLYAAGSAKLDLGGREVAVTQETDYPWSGEVKITVRRAEPASFAVNLRIPGWCEGATAKVSGEKIEAAPGDNGYLTIDRRWRAGDTIKLNLPMPVERVVANPSVKADVGRVALRRGPVVYCLEGVDNGGSIRDIWLPPEAKLEARFRPNLLGGVTVLRGKALRRAPVEWSGVLYQPAQAGEAVDIVAVPYYAWDNREAGEMIVWLPETPTLAEAKLPPTIALEGEPTASHVQGRLRAVNDGLVPSSSNDHSIPRFTWWDHRGTREWVGLSFAQPARLSCIEVYWFDDTGRGQCRVPESWHVEWLDGDQWRPVTGATAYGTAPDTFNRVTFDPVQTTGLRLEVQLQEDFSGGILELRLPQ
ncbi:MAG: glycoside hydrolase family 127 protein [Armatimonadota bacterium]